MDVWPTNGWFLGLRRTVFTRAARRRIAVGLIVVLASVPIAERIGRPDPSRLEQEQYAVYSAYLFKVPVGTIPLPVVCAENPEYTGVPPGEGGFAEIRQYFVSNQTISAISRPSVFAPIIERKIAAPAVPISVFNSFIIRNLSASQLTKKFSDPNSNRLVLQHQPPDVSAFPQPTLSAKFTQVGFNRDFTWAMFYAEVNCGKASGREYVYLAKSFYRGWYWHVAGVDRN